MRRLSRTLATLITVAIDNTTDVRAAGASSIKILCIASTTTRYAVAGLAAAGNWRANVIRPVHR
jgi:hypothetical protein